MRLPITAPASWRRWLVPVALVGLFGSIAPGSLAAADETSLSVEPVAVRSAAAPPAAAQPEAAPSPSVILYGDSLAGESQGYFQSALVASGITDVHAKTFGGTALCDWLEDMRSDAIGLHPTSVVIEFSGNALTPCMQNANGAPLTGDAYYRKYEADVAAAFTIFTTTGFSPTGARVYLVGTPMSRRSAESHDPDAGRLNALYARFGSADLVEYVDAGAAVLDHGAWTNVLPCRPDEPCTGGVDVNGTPVNVVRAADGTHFCPTSPVAIQGVTPACSVWSSGAFRFGTAMANAVLRDVH